jgi:hypothetical protein
VADLNPRMTRITIFLICGFLLLLGGCGTYSSHMDEMLNEYICEENSPQRVGPNREVVLFVKHHIMVGKPVPGVEPGREMGFIRTSRYRIPWENNRFASYRSKEIPSLMEEVNELLFENDTNIFLVSDSVDQRVDDNFSPANLDLLNQPQGHTREVMEKIVAEDPGYIHILYGWTSGPGPHAVAGDNLAVVVANDPRYDGRLESLELARAIVHALGYKPGPVEATSSMMGSLMDYASQDDDLSKEQVGKIWQAVNGQKLTLKSITCHEP